MRTLTPLTRLAPGERSTRSFAILSSFPPTPCGIATFSAALAAGLVANGAAVDVVRCGTTPEMEDSLVLASLADGVGAAIDVLNDADVAIIQHEYGIYDGPDGDAVLAVLEGLVVPTIVVAHTVLQGPTLGQRVLLDRVCDAADAVVVMTESARARLIDGFDVVASKVHVIAHGAATPLADASPESEQRRNRTSRLLTWGLLGPGKGIEWAIDAVATLGDLRPRPTYLIAGSTHPKVLEQDGQAYRKMLIRRAWSTGSSPFVSFDDTYRDLASLTALIISHAPSHRRR